MIPAGDCLRTDMVLHYLGDKVVGHGVHGRRSTAGYGSPSQGWQESDRGGIGHNLTLQPPRSTQL